jgi:MFS family permease
VMIAVQRKEIAASFGTPEWLISLLYALFFFGAGFGGLLLDQLIRRCGPRRVLFLGAIGNVVGGIACYYARSFELFLVSFAWLSLCAAPFFTWLVALSSGWLPRFPALSLAGVTVGQLVAFWPWERILVWAGGAGNWRGGLLALAVGGGVQVVLVLMLTLSTTSTTDHNPPEAPPSLDVWPFAVSMFLVVCSSTILLLSLRQLELLSGTIGPIGLFGRCSDGAISIRRPMRRGASARVAGGRIRPDSGGDGDIQMGRNACCAVVRRRLAVRLRLCRISAGSPGECQVVVPRISSTQHKDTPGVGKSGHCAGLFHFRPVG